MLEAMTRSGAYQPYVLHLGMSIRQEIAVRTVLVLADPGFQQRRILQGREQLSQTPPHFDDLLLGHKAIGGIGIEGRAVVIVRDLEAAVFQIGNTIGAGIDIDPGGHGRGRPAPVTGRDGEKEDVLARWKDALAQQSRKHFPEPWSAGEDQRAGADPISRAGADGGCSTGSGGRGYRLRKKMAALIDKVLHYGLNRPPRHQCAALRLVYSRYNTAEIDLWKSLLELAW